LDRWVSFPTPLTISQLPHQSKAVRKSKQGTESQLSTTYQCENLAKLNKYKMSEGYASNQQIVTIQHE